jgi:hypothetical protein
MRAFIFLGRLYRANPLRPHCNVAEGRHVWLCRFLNLPSAGTGYGMVGTEMMKPLFRKDS